MGGLVLKHLPLKYFKFISPQTIAKYKKKLTKRDEPIETSHYLDCIRNCIKSINVRFQDS